MVQKNPNRYEWRMPLELLFLGQERYEVTRLKGEGTTTTLCPKIETEPFLNKMARSKQSLTLSTIFFFCAEGGVSTQ